MPRPWPADAEEKLLTDALDQVAARRQRRHRLRLGGRAPLPRGVLALQRARGVPRRRQPAHPADPARARHRADPAGLQPPRAGGRACRDARPDLRRARRLRHRRVELPDGAGRLRRRPRDQARAVGGGARRDHAHVRRGAVRRATRAASSRCRRAPSCPSRSRSRTRRCGWRARRRETILLAARRGHRRADVRVHRAGAGEGVGRRVLRDHRSPTNACRPASP